MNSWTIARHAGEAARADAAAAAGRGIVPLEFSVVGLTGAVTRGLGSVMAGWVLLRAVYLLTHRMLGVGRYCASRPAMCGSLRWHS